MKIIKEQEENGGRITVSNEDINKAVDKSFQYSHENLSAVLNYMGQQIGAEATNFLTKELLKNQAQTEGLGNLIELTKKGETYLKKYKEIIDKAPLIAPSQAILEIMKKEGCVFGLQNPIVLAEKGEEEKAEAVRKILTESIPSHWIEDNNQGRIIIIKPTSWKGQKDRSFHFLCLDKKEMRKAKKKYKPQEKQDFSPQQGDSFIALSSKTEKKTIIHEFAHRLELLYPEIKGIFQQYFQIRTKNDTKKKVIDCLLERNKNLTKEDLLEVLFFNEDELTKEDKFYSPYMGKVGKNNQAEELMTTSFEFLLGDSKDFLNFLQQERELFCLTLGVLVEYGKRR